MTEQSPQAVECLPVVGYANLTDIDERSMRRDTWLVETPCKYRATALTPRDPAQATIDRLTRERDEWRGKVTQAHREREAAVSAHEAAQRAGFSFRDEVIALRAELATLKARALDVDAVMALADVMADARSADEFQQREGFDDADIASAKEDHIAARAALLATLKEHTCPRS